jgi:aerobic-type carbon monoxide dehydrogenase small subunit (CoxS/CutS family)
LTPACRGTEDKKSKFENGKSKLTIRDALSSKWLCELRISIFELPFSEREVVQKELIHLRVNGELHELPVPTNKLLLEVLREDLGLTGTKCGCDDSSCGACTVLVNGEPQMSCLMLAASYQEAEITTIEGVAKNGELDPLQIGFMEEGGAQCGFCTPGMILTCTSFLKKNPAPSDQELREALSGNLCRCTGYTQILASIRRAIALARERRPAEVARA